MEWFTSIYTWFTSHWDTILLTLPGFILFFDRLSKLTPNNTDNVIVETLYRLFTILGVRVPELEANNKGEIVQVKAVTEPVQK